MERKVIVVIATVVLVIGLPAAYIHFTVTAGLDDLESEGVAESTVSEEVTDRLVEEIDENFKEIDERVGAVTAVEEVVRALQDVNEEQLIDSLIAATTSQVSDTVRENAVSTLFHFYGHVSLATDSKIISAFFVALADAVPDVSSVASRNLTNIFCVEPIESLISFSYSGSAVVVDLAIKALVARANECSFAQLDSIINSHPNPKLVNAAMLVYHEWQHDLGH